MVSVWEMNLEIESDLNICEAAEKLKFQNFMLLNTNKHQ